MKRILLICSGLLIIAAIVAGGAAAQVRYSRELIQEGFYNFVMSGGHVSQVSLGPKPSGAIGAAMVTGVADQVRTYAQSPDFRKKWAEYAKNSSPEPQPPVPMRPLSQLRLQNGPDTSQTDKQMSQALENIKNLPQEYQAQVRAQIEQARAQMKKEMKDNPPQRLSDEQLLEREKGRYAQDKEKYDEAVRMAISPDPNAAIRKALRTALSETAGIDYDAKLRGRQFATPEYEQKGADWKMGYRAGRNATESARAFAQKWLGELK